MGSRVKAGARVAIVERFPIHQAVGLVNLPIVIIVVGLSILSGPLGGITLQRLVREQVDDPRRRSTLATAGGAHR